MSCKIHWECEDEPCPYCEIDSLKGELEDKTQMYEELYEHHFREHHTPDYQRIEELERQLDASQVLLAEARAENERLTIQRDFAQSELKDVITTRGEAWNAGRKLTAYEILDKVARSVGKQSQLYKQICVDYKLEG